MDFLILLAGLAVLIIGGEFLVKGAVGFSHAMKISPLVIGMTVVAFGTSAPELLVSLQSAMGGNPGIAIGNVVGSNIANIALVLGVTVIIFPIVADRQTMRVDFPMLMLSTLLFFYFASDGLLTLVEGIILFSMVVVFTTFLITSSRKKTKKNELNSDEVLKKEPFWKSTTFLLLGFIGLYFGAGWFIDGAVSIANYFLEGNPDKDTIIGVTVVAFGTSAPELVASCVAAYRKETDISVGNLIGSNIFNILVVLGITSMVKPIEVTQEVIEFDMIYMIGIAILLMFILAIGKKIGRLKGMILILSYISYIAIILLRIKGVI
jgi:cation:H+ antiporter